MKSRISRFLLAGLPLSFVGSLFAAEYFVAPDGKPTGRGTLDSPWDLATALSNPTVVKPMDTIWLRGGAYRGTFTSSLRGAPDHPIIVKQYPGERATLDGNIGRPGSTLTVQGEWTWYWGFEVMNSRTDRSAATPGSSPPGGPGMSISVYGPNVKLINLIVHDGGGAYGVWKQALNAEVYGSLIYNSGWLAPDRGHGHAIYTQNDQGTKVIEDNIIFNQFGNGLQLYGSPHAKLQGYEIRGNVHFNDRFLVGGGAPAENIEVIENYLYRNEAGFYYTSHANHNLTLLNNYFAVPVRAYWWDHVRAEGNTFYAAGGANLSLRLVPGGASTDHCFDRNVYLTRPGSQPKILIQAVDGGGNQSFTFAQLREKLGWEKNGEERLLAANVPAGPAVFVRRNKYEPTRGHIVVYNWPHWDSVDVDISVMNLLPGDRYELRNAQNYYAEAIAGTFTGGPIRVPMREWTIANPIGMDHPIEPSTFPEFGVFVLTVTKSAKLSTR